jgi:predicted HTH domain antitoxin
MAIANIERIEIDLPADIIFAMHATDKPEEIQKKLKMALAIFLFQEGSISLGKATELAEMNRVRFIEMLTEYGLAAYEYSEKDFERDQQAVAAYRHTIEE